MSSNRISKKLRDDVRARAMGRCEYCAYPEVACYVSFDCDHCCPQGAGGATIESNLAWACPTCNGSKGDARRALDPLTRATVELFNPRIDWWKDHFKWSTDALRIVGRSAKGRATIERLRMNRPSALSIRAILIQLDLHPPV